MAPGRGPGPLAWRDAPALTGARPTLRLRLLGLGGVLFALSNALWSAWDQGWTYDEPYHLLWSERFVASGVIERTSQERLNSKTPVMIPNVLARRAAAAAGIEGPRGLRFAARLPSAFWLLALLGTVFLFAKKAFGIRAGLIAALLSGLEPNLAAHGSLATVDAAYAFAHLLALGAALAFGRSPTLARGLALGFAVGLAFTAKFSAFLLLPALAMALLLMRLPWRRALPGLAAAVAMAWLALCAAYLFDRIGQPMSAHEWRSAPFQALAHAGPGLRVPLPAAFAEGLDLTLATERGAWNSILLGRLYLGGVWYYFLVLWLLKTPLLLLAVEILGFARAARDRQLTGHPAARLLAFSLLLLLAYFSFMFRAHIGYRFVLMCIPMACILAAAGVATLPLTPGVHWTARALMLLALLENLQYFGNPLSFTHAAVQPKRLAFRLIADSNLDWGQNRERLGRLLGRAGARRTHLDPVHIVPGHNTLDVNALAGVWDFEQHRWAREHLSPGGHFGHTNVWFLVDDETFDRFLQEARRLDPAPAPAGACPSELPREDHPIGARVPFARTENPAPGAGWAICVAARKGGDFGLRVNEGHLRFGRFRADGSCDAELVTEGKVAWFRLEPGEHALCAVEIPNRRPWLPYRLDATWLIRGRGMQLGISPSTFTAPTPPAPEDSTPRSSSLSLRPAG